MNFRSAITGRWVSRLFARSHPATTVSETLSVRDTSADGTVSTIHSSWGVTTSTGNWPQPYPFPKAQVRCSFCLKDIPLDSVVCPHCQSELDGGDAA